MFKNLNIKLWLIASVAVFVLMSIFEYLVHGVWLASLYADPKYIGWWRSGEEMMQFMGWMYVGYACFALLFTYIYTKGYESTTGVAEGFRYGIVMGLFTQLPRMFAMHSVYPYPRDLLLSWFFSGLIECIIFGIVVGFIYKGQAKRAT